MGITNKDKENCTRSTFGDMKRYIYIIYEVMLDPCVWYKFYTERARERRHIILVNIQYFLKDLKFVELDCTVLRICISCIDIHYTYKFITTILRQDMSINENSWHSLF